MIRSLIVSISLLFFTLCMEAQSFDFLNFTHVRPYHNSAAVLYNDQVLDAEYFVREKPKLGMGTGAVISMATVSETEQGSEPIKKIKFHVAIKNKRTNTTWIYTQEAASELELDEVMKKCEAGDYIIFMPVDQQYSLSHHEMWVAVGC